MNTERNFTAECSIKVDVENVKTADVNKVIAYIEEKIGLGNCLACIPRYPDTLEITLSSTEYVTYFSNENIVINNTVYQCEPLYSPFIVVSILNLPAYTTDEEICEKLSEFKVEICGPVVKNYHKIFRNCMDGTRHVKCRFPPGLNSLPWALNFRTVAGPKSFKVIHNNQRKVCFYCYDENHLKQSCPKIQCRKCKEYGHLSYKCSKIWCKPCRKLDCGIPEHIPNPNEDNERTSPTQESTSNDLQANTTDGNQDDTHTNTKNNDIEKTESAEGKNKSNTKDSPESKLKSDTRQGNLEQEDDPKDQTQVDSESKIANQSTESEFREETTSDYQQVKNNENKIEDRNVKLTTKTEGNEESIEYMEDEEEEVEVVKVDTSPDSFEQIRAAKKARIVISPPKNLVTPNESTRIDYDDVPEIDVSDCSIIKSIDESMSTPPPLTRRNLQFKNPKPETLIKSVNERLKRVKELSQATN
ncbi:hypothetical protein SNE40_022162 [Patella caerulea]|uniref:CCHC-type domain-containing protein n=1 Tax=Patella caerulea TaxID=87958 RepID=A0AAN8G6W9_PATCE